MQLPRNTKFHHRNVDRLVAIWQALNPNSFTTPQADQFGTFTNRPGAIEDVNTSDYSLVSPLRGTIVLT